MECYICGNDVGLYYDGVCQDCLTPELEAMEELEVLGLLLD